jgi:hypothetical protein
VKTPENILPFNEMLSVANRVANAKEREKRCSPEQLQQRNLAMGYFLARLFESMPTISRNSVVKLVGAKEVNNIRLGSKDLSKSENAKVNYDIKDVFEYVTKIKSTELF